MRNVLVNNETLFKIDDLVKSKDWSPETTLENAVNSLWLSHCIDQSNLIEINTKNFKVKPKQQYKAYLCKLMGYQGPYQVIKTYQSWTGASEGVYKIKGSSTPLPCSWFIESNLEKTLATSLIISALTCLFQSGALIYILLI